MGLHGIEELNSCHPFLFKLVTVYMLHLQSGLDQDLMFSSSVCAVVYHFKVKMKLEILIQICFGSNFSDQTEC